MIRNPTRDGILPLDKPVGPTSHDMVASARRALRMKKVGHTGTLDPFASGLLLLVLGRATRLAEHLDGFPKEYVARARLGILTATDDREGDVLKTSDAWGDISPDEIAVALRGFLGEGLQRPPMYSAKKIGGDRAYALARKGIQVDLPESRITVHEIELLLLDLPHLEFRVRCSTGTYVRGLARDLGQALGVGAHLTELRRTSIGPHRVEGALPPDRLEDPDAVAKVLVPPLAAVAHLPRIEVDPEAAKLLQSGQFLPAREFEIPEAVGDMVISCRERLVSIATLEGSWIRPRKVFPFE